MFGSATAILLSSQTDGLMNLLNGMTGWVGAAGKVLVVLIGLVMVIGGVFQIAKGMLGGQRAQTNWVMAIGLILVGGALAFSGGFSMLANVSKDTAGTINAMSAGGDNYGYDGGTAYTDTGN